MDPASTIDAPEEVFKRGALRTALVARLSGATVRQLQYWHRTNLIRATVVGGKRGVPRMYSWVGYMKARVAVKLINRKVTTRRLRAHIEWLESREKDWYKLPLVVVDRRVHVVREDRSIREAAPGEQMVLAQLVSEVLSEIAEEGSLGALASYSDAVDMNPAIKSGSPILKGTRIETRLLKELMSRDGEVAAFAAGHSIRPRQLERAIEFEDHAVAA